MFELLSAILFVLPFFLGCLAIVYVATKVKEFFDTRLGAAVALVCIFGFLANQGAF